MEHVHAYADKAKAELNKIPILVQLEEQTGVDKLYLSLGGSVLLLLIVIVGFGFGLLCSLVGFIYPAYASFKAIESEQKKDDEQWLTYWVVYSCFEIVEVFVDILLYWIPFYHAFKLGFLVWMFLPSTQGASFLFHHFLQPFLKANECHIDGAINSVKNNSASVVSDITGAAKDVAKDVSAFAAKKMAEQNTSAPPAPSSPKKTK
jgi:receptor expression-enhancing protein 5/6